MEPGERKKRILIALAGAVISLVVMGVFFWPFLKTMLPLVRSGKPGAKVPLLVFGGFFLVMVLGTVGSVISGIRKISPPDQAGVPVAAQPGSGKFGLVFLGLFSLPFAGFGLFALVQAFHKWSAGKEKDAAFLALFGLIFSGVGFGLLIFAMVSGKRQKQENLARSKNSDKPWFWRADWAAGKIKPTVGPEQNFFWIWSVFALAVSVPAVLAIPKEWHKGNHLILVALLFPVVAFYLIGYSIVKWRSRRRFGECFFEPAQIPSPLGGTLEGMIQTGANIRLEHGLQLKLSCIRRSVTGSGDNRSTREDVLWQDEKIFAANANLPEPEPGRSGIPVFFKLPADQPQSFPDGNNAIIWRLEAKARLSGPDFGLAFEVPVFGSVAADAAAGEANEPDPTASLQMSVEELRRDEHSKIRVTDGPGGREFYFPAARNFGAASGLTVFLLIWSGFVWFMFTHKAPILFPIVFGLVAVLVAIACLNLWLKSSRVTIDPSGVTLVNHYLMFGRTRRVPASEIVRFDLKTGMISGTKVYQDIKLVTRASAEKMEARRLRFQQAGAIPNPRFNMNISGLTLGNNIPNATEARWLVQEMTRALGRSV